MSNPAYDSVDTDVVTPRDEKKDRGKEGPDINEGPKMRRATLPPINIQPRGYQIQPPSNPALMPQTPLSPRSPLSPLETHPMMGYTQQLASPVPQQATNIPPQARYVSQQATNTQPQATYMPPQAANIPQRATYIPTQTRFAMPPTVAQPLNPNTDYTKNPRPAWAHNCVMMLSIIIIISGIIIFIMNIVGLVTSVDFAYVGSGFWGGVFMMITGGIGVCASKTKTTCKIISLMVLAIILAVLSGGIFGAHITGALIAGFGDTENNNNVNYNYWDYKDYVDESSLEFLENYNCTHPNQIVNRTYCNGTIAYRMKAHDYEILKEEYAISQPYYYKPDDDDEPDGKDIGIAFNAILTVAGLLEFVACIIASALSCRAVCCRSTSNVIQVIYVPATGTVQMNPPYPQGHYVSHGSNHQAVSIPPHGQLQQQYVQNQGIVTSQNMTTFSHQVGAMGYDTTQTQQGIDPYATRESPPPPYNPSPRNVMAAVD